MTISARQRPWTHNLKNEFKNHQSRVTCFKMQQKTDGRVVRLLTKHLAAGRSPVGGTGLLRFPDQSNGDELETITESEPDKFK